MVLLAPKYEHMEIEREERYSMRCHAMAVAGPLLWNFISKWVLTGSRDHFVGPKELLGGMEHKVGNNV